jgi:hypothetical protein
VKRRRNWLVVYTLYNKNQAPKNFPSSKPEVMKQCGCCHNFPLFVHVWHFFASLRYNYSLQISHNPDLKMNMHWRLFVKVCHMDEQPCLLVAQRTRRSGISRRSDRGVCFCSGEAGDTSEVTVWCLLEFWFKGYVFGCECGKQLYLRDVTRTRDPFPGVLLVYNMN